MVECPRVGKAIPNIFKNYTVTTRVEKAVKKRFNKI
jgi:hypothetical protein